MKILICGSRYYSNYKKVKNYLKKMIEETGKNLIVVEGGARGTDSLARKGCKELDIPFKEYKANWQKYGRGAGPIRNQKMLDDNPDIKKVVAFHEDIDKSKGTKDMIKRAKKNNIDIELYS